MIQGFLVRWVKKWFMLEENRWLFMQFERFISLIGEDAFLRLKKKRITIIGVGGVGSYVFEALVRCGIENITIIDPDVITITNLNRQLMTTLDTVGESKVEVLKKRASSINENVNITCIGEFITSDNISLVSSDTDYIIDCCDTVRTKCAIIEEALSKNIPFVTCLGMGKRLDPSFLRICDLKKTYNDPLAKVIRKWVKDHHIHGKITCCFSSELPIATDSKEIASSSFVPSSAGLLIASYIVRNILKKN